VWWCYESDCFYGLTDGYLKKTTLGVLKNNEVFNATEQGFTKLRLIFRGYTERFQTLSQMGDIVMIR